MPQAKKIAMGLAVVAIGLLIYNKIPAVKKALGGV
jgi:hypothetical protein